MNSMIKEALGKHDVEAIRAYQHRVNKPDLSHIPGDSGWPLLGHTPILMTDLHKFLNDRYSKHGPIFRIKGGGIDGITLLGTDANRLVLQNEDKRFSNYLAWDPIFSNLFDNNVLERDFASHKSTRKSLQLAFKRDAIEGHMEIMNPIFEKQLLMWPTCRPIKVMDSIKALLLNVGAKVFLGVEIGKEAKRLNEAFVSMVNGTIDPFKRKEIFFSPFAKGVRARKTLSKFVFDNIDERRLIKERDIFSQLCHLEDESGKRLSDEEVRDQIIFVLFAAHDTTTSALSSTLYELASNPEWQEEIREELRGLKKDKLEFSDIARLEKTTWTFKEVLRMYPAVSALPRYTLEEFEFHGYRVPANTPLIVFPLFTHHMKEYWTNPYQFDPLRFSPERAEDKKDFFQYAPFGGGAHKCLGLHFAEIQTKMFLFYLLKYYRVTKNKKMTKYRYTNAPMTFPTDGLPLTLEKL